MGATEVCGVEGLGTGGGRALLVVGVIWGCGRFCCLVVAGGWPACC